MVDWVTHVLDAGNRVFVIGMEHDDASDTTLFQLLRDSELTCVLPAWYGSW